MPMATTAPISLRCDEITPLFAAGWLARRGDLLLAFFLRDLPGDDLVIAFSLFVTCTLGLALQAFRQRRLAGIHRIALLFAVPA